MRPTRLVTIAAATAAATLALGGAPVGGQEPEQPSITVDPTSAPAGTTLDVTGTGCPGTVSVELWEVGTVSVVDEAAAEGDDSGDWSAEVTLPETAQVNSLYHVKAECQVDGGPEYGGVHIRVTSKWPEGVFTIEVDPVSGPIGTTIQVAGSSCSENDAVDIEYALLAGTSMDDVSAVIDAGSIGLVDPDPITDGWRGELVVYDTMLDFVSDPEEDFVEVDVVPGDDYFVIATCTPVTASGGAETVFSEPVDFDVTGDATAPRPDETPPQDTAIIPVVPQAQAAAPVVAQPTYTG